MVQDMTLLKSKRKRKKGVKETKISYKGYDLGAVLVSDPKNLNTAKRDLLKEYYNHTGHPGVVKTILSSKYLPFAAHVFSDLGIEKDFWTIQHSKFVQRNTDIINLVNIVFSKLAIYGCNSVTLTENFAVVLSGNSCIGCFCSGDVDLSADISEIKQIIDCFEELNFHSKEQPEAIGEYTGQSMQFFNNDVIDNGFWINVIWKPVTRAFLIQEKYEKRLHADRLIAKLIPDTNIRVLDNTSLMYFCALHIASGHYYTLTPGLRLYVDIDRLARGTSIDWCKIADWEEEDEAGIRISVVLYIANKLFGTPIPEEAYKKAIINRRNKRLVDYLLKLDTLEIQDRSSKIRRLYIELASDGTNLFLAIGKRLSRLIN